LPDREDQDEVRDGARCHTEHRAEQGAEVERHCVVQKGLAHEQRETQDRALGVELDRHLGDLPERDRLALAHGDAGARFGEWFVGLVLHLLFDTADYSLRIALPAVDEQPPGALWDSAAHQEDEQPEQGTEAEREPPAEVGGEDRLVEQQQGEQATGGRPHPVAAVDGDVDLATVAGGDQLVDRRVDRGVLTADARPGEESAEEEVPGSECEGRCHRGDDVERQGQHHQFLPAEPVGELTEEQCTQAGAGDVDGCGEADVRDRHGDAAAGFGEPGSDGPDDGHLEAVEDPDGAEAGDDPPVESGPGKPVQSGRDLGADGSELNVSGHCPRPVHGLRCPSAGAAPPRRTVCFAPLCGRQT
jgi:hypothetical protein